MTSIKTAEDFNKTVGTRLRAFRLSKGITVASMADALGITKWRMTYIENGVSEPTGFELYTAAQVFGVTTSAITGETPATAKEGSADE